MFVSTERKQLGNGWVQHSENVIFPFNILCFIHRNYAHIDLPKCEMWFIRFAYYHYFCESVCVCVCVWVCERVCVRFCMMKNMQLAIPWQLAHIMHRVHCQGYNALLIWQVKNAMFVKYRVYFFKERILLWGRCNQLYLHHCLYSHARDVISIVICSTTNTTITVVVLHSLLLFCCNYDSLHYPCNLDVP